MSAARAAVLGRVRAAQRTAILPGSALGIPHPPSRIPNQDLIPGFERELAALGVEVQHAATADAVRDAVRAHTAGLRVLSWDPQALPYGAFDVLLNPVRGSSSRAEQAAADIGVTGCDAAVAETGSLILLSGPGRARTVSLLPPVHLAIVRRTDMVETLADAFHRLEGALRVSASCTVITGPSRTADIELTLTLGIHGPGRVVVVIGP